METDITVILNKFCKELKKIDKTKSVSATIKTIDSKVQKLYLDLYLLRDGNKNQNISIKDNKRGHCC